MTEPERKLRRVLALSLLFVAGMLLSGPVRAQVAGLNTLALLQSPSSARAAALGLDFLPLYAPDDIHVGLDNPSLVSTSYNNRLGLNYEGFFAGSKAASVAYGRDFHRFGSFLFGLHYYGYGKFEGYDEFEVAQGEFSASDVALVVAWGLNIDSNFSIGASLRPVLSQYESYPAFALALGVAGSYVSDDKRFTATVQARNVGAQLATFDGTVERLPFDLTAAISYKVSNAPFRLYLALNQLTRWNLSYDDPLNPETQIDPYTGLPVARPWYDGAVDVLDQFMRHVSLGLEFDIRQLFFARIGYRHRQAAEMDAESRTNFNTSGFSFGFGLRTKRFEFSYARCNYHLGQAPNYLSLAFKL